MCSVLLVDVCFQDANPRKLVRFPGQPDAQEVIIEVNRRDPDEPMSFQVKLWACYEVVTETTPSAGTTSSAYAGTSGTASGFTQTASEYTSGFGSATTSSAYAGTSGTASGFTQTASEYTTGGAGATTVCNIDEGMDEPQYIPNKNIRDENDKVPEDVGMLRPGSNRPFSVNRNTILLKVWLMPARRLASVRLIRPDNVEYITVWYIRPTSKTSRERPVAEVGWHLV